MLTDKTIGTIREALTEVKGLARTLDQVKHYKGKTYYQDKITRIDEALAELAALRQELAAHDTLAITLFDALRARDNCEDCGGTGWHWSAVGTDEPEAEPCSCANEAHDLFVEHHILIEKMRRVQQREPSGRALPATGADD